MMQTNKGPLPMRNSLPICLVVCVFISACSKNESSTQTTPSDHQTLADSIYVNGQIYTVDVNESWAEAMAVKDGQLIAVGNNMKIEAHRGEHTVVHDLAGRMVMPGIHDTHAHPTVGGIWSNFDCMFATNDVAEVLEILRTCAEDTPEGEWIRGGQWNDGHFSSGQMPKRILDEALPNHPVFLMDWSVHNAWVNSLALERLGITDDTPNPSGGVIVRDLRTGEATGILYDNAAYNSQHLLPPYTPEQYTTALSWSMQQMASVGVTSFKEAIVTEPSVIAYDTLAKSDQLPLRVNTSLTWKSAWAKSNQAEITLIDNRADYAHDRVDVDYAKIMLDGIPPTYTAALLEPYEPSVAFGNNYRGKLMIDPEQLKQDVIALDAKGLTIKIHATGDRSLRVALDAFEAARKANGDSGLIHEVSHAEMVHPDDLPRFAELNVAAEMCPIIWYPSPLLPWETWVGATRARVWPVKALIDSGALVIYGSDWPVVPSANPWPGIESMVTRKDPYGQTPGTDWPEQRVDLSTAIRIFTFNGAKAHKSADVNGSLEPGKQADFIVLDQNIFDVDIDTVGDTKVLLTVVNGDWVYGKL